MQSIPNDRGKYPGYPRYVIVAFPKTGTKTMFKVFDLMQMADFAPQFNKFGKMECDFAELAKIWEENEYDVIIEPAGIMWTWMVDHWPKTKFIHVTRDDTSWATSYENFIRVCMDGIPKTTPDHLMANNSFLSDTANEYSSCFDSYCRNLVHC